MDSASDLQRWMTEVMGHADLCSAVDLEAVCSGPMAEVWRWIILHSRTREEVRKIRGNLGFSQLRGSTAHGMSRRTGRPGPDWELWLIRIGRNSLDSAWPLGPF